LEPEERVTVGLQIVQKLSDTETRPAILGSVTPPTILSTVVMARHMVDQWNQDPARAARLVMCVLASVPLP